MEQINELNSYHATTVILAFLLVFGVMVPIVGVIPKVKEIISLRYITLIVWLACMVGIIVNFSNLSDSVKLAVVISTAIMSAIYICFRSIEKWMYNGWKLGKEVKASVQKGDAKLEVELKEKDKDSKDDVGESK